MFRDDVDRLEFSISATAALILSQAAKKSSRVLKSVLGLAVTPAADRTFGLYHSTFERWILTGTL